MNIIDALLGEHAVLATLFDALEACADSATSVDELSRAASPVAAALVSHARLEDELLFPALRDRLGPDGLTGVMADDHVQIDRLLQDVLRATDVEAASSDLLYALELARDHFEREETVLFLDARDVLSAATCEQLGQQWAKLRRVALSD